VATITTTVAVDEGRAVGLGALVGAEVAVVASVAVGDGATGVLACVGDENAVGMADGNSVGAPRGGDDTEPEQAN
jgi:hypothetical protein